MASFTERMMGAARLDVATYNEVEKDESATSQAMLVVVLSSLAAGIGVGGTSIMAMLLGAVLALVGWAAWAFVAWFVGTKLLPEPQTEADWGQLARTLGFASVPGLAKILGIIPLLGGLISFAASIWMLATMVIAVREALDYTSTGRAVAVCLVGFLVYLLIALGIGIMVGAAGIAAAGLTAG